MSESEMRAALEDIVYDLARLRERDPEAGGAFWRALYALPADVRPDPSELTPRALADWNERRLAERVYAAMFPHSTLPDAPDAAEYVVAAVAQMVADRDLARSLLADALNAQARQVPDAISAGVGDGVVERWRPGDVDTSGRVVLDVGDDGAPTRWYDPSADRAPRFGMVLAYGSPGWAADCWRDAKRRWPE